MPRLPWLRQALDMYPTAVRNTVACADVKAASPVDSRAMTWRQPYTISASKRAANAGGTFSVGRTRTSATKASRLRSALESNRTAHMSNTPEEYGFTCSVRSAHKGVNVARNRTLCKGTSTRRISMPSTNVDPLGVVEEPFGKEDRGAKSPPPRGSTGCCGVMLMLLLALPFTGGADGSVLAPLLLTPSAIISACEDARKPHGGARPPSWPSNAASPCDWSMAGAPLEGANRDAPTVGTTMLFSVNLAPVALRGSTMTGPSTRENTSAANAGGTMGLARKCSMQSRRCWETLACGVEEDDRGSGDRGPRRFAFAAATCKLP